MSLRAYSGRDISLSVGSGFGVQGERGRIVIRAENRFQVKSIRTRAIRGGVCRSSFRPNLTSGEWTWTRTRTRDCGDRRRSPADGQVVSGLRCLPLEPSPRRINAHLPLRVLDRQRERGRERNTGVSFFLSFFPFLFSSALLATC